MIKLTRDKYTDGKPCWIARDERYPQAIGYADTQDLAIKRLKTAIHAIITHNR